MRSLILLASMTVCLGLQAGAATADDCDNAASQAALNTCAEQSLQASDAELNKLYRKILARIDDQETKNLFISAQRAWIAFRDAECAFTSSEIAGGSAYPMVVMLCRDKITQNRTVDFNDYLKCEEGDLSCPVRLGK